MSEKEGTNLSFDQLREMGFVVIGPKEVENAFLAADGNNPLGLKSGWCPNIPLPWSSELLMKLALYCKETHFNSTPILWLAIPKVNGKPTSLLHQYRWWGCNLSRIYYNNLRPQFAGGHLITIHDKIIEKPVTTKFKWKISYLYPLWLDDKIYREQIEMAKQFGYLISDIVSTSFIMNLMMANYPEMISPMFIRTNTFIKSLSDISLSIHLDRSKVIMIDHSYDPNSRNRMLFLAIEGIPNNL